MNRIYLFIYFRLFFLLYRRDDVINDVIDENFFAHWQLYSWS